MSPEARPTSATSSNGLWGLFARYSSRQAAAQLLKCCPFSFCLSWLFSPSETNDWIDTKAYTVPERIDNMLFIPNRNTFFVPLLVVLLPAGLVVILLKLHRDKEQKKQKKAILETFSGKYNSVQLDRLIKNNKKEFRRLYKLSSDEFFRRYIKEQADHVKAQELIVELQRRIDRMNARLVILEKRNWKNKNEIQYLRHDIQMYEEICNSWQRVS